MTLFSKTVDSIVGKVLSAINELDAVAEAKLEEADVHSNKAQAHMGKRDACEVEATRAQRVAEKLRELVD